MRRIFLTIILWFSSVMIRCVTFFVRSAVQNKKLTNDELGLFLLKSELNETAPSFGFTDDLYNGVNPNKLKILKILKKIQDDQNKSTAVVQKRMFGKIKQTSSPYDDLKFITKDTDPNIVKLINKEIEVLELQKFTDKLKKSEIFAQNKEEWASAYQESLLKFQNAVSELNNLKKESAIPEYQFCEK